MKSEPYFFLGETPLSSARAGLWEAEIAAIFGAGECDKSYRTFCGEGVWLERGVVFFDNPPPDDLGVFDWWGVGVKKEVEREREGKNLYFKPLASLPNKTVGGS